MYYLAAYSEYIKPLREEIEAVVNEHGWSKASMGKMRKLDSLLKESQRMTGLGSRMLSFLIRLSLSYVVFSFDGPIHFERLHIFRRYHNPRRYLGGHGFSCHSLRWGSSVLWFILKDSQRCTGYLSRSRHVSRLSLFGNARIWISQTPHGNTEPWLSGIRTWETCLSWPFLRCQRAEGHDGSSFAYLWCQTGKWRVTSSAPVVCACSYSWWESKSHVPC